jgi:signal transduction histidine kinase
VIPAGDWLVIAALTATCSVVALGGGALLLRALARRSVALHLVVACGATLATVAGAVLVTAREMFLSDHDARVVLVVVGLSAASAAGVALLLATSLRRGTRALADAATRVGDESYRQPRPVPNAELRTVADALHRTHERLESSRTARDASERSRRQLVAGMSHDLRTPLAGMRAMVESLEDGLVADHETVDRYHHQLRLEIDRLAGMVSDLFELSRVEGPLQLQLERIAAADLVDEAVASADPVARAKGVRLQADAVGGLPVEVDPTEFGRVMRNLLLNAIRHTPGDGTIAVRAAADGGRVTISVSDGCGGIPDRDLERVFEAAYRGDAARTTTPGLGAGLGLAIARGIVEAHRGVIRVGNHHPGCRFEVLLPVAPD